MRVFKMNDFDWVCAVSEDQAKEFYTKECNIDIEDVEHDFVGEVPLTDTMYVGEELLTEVELYQAREWKQFPDGQLLTPMTFAEVIRREGITKPRIISTTEF